MPQVIYMPENKNTVGAQMAQMLPMLQQLALAKIQNKWTAEAEERLLKRQTAAEEAKRKKDEAFKVKMQEDAQQHDFDLERAKPQSIVRKDPTTGNFYEYTGPQDMLKKFQSSVEGGAGINQYASFGLLRKPVKDPMKTSSGVTVNTGQKPFQKVGEEQAKQIVEMHGEAVQMAQSIPRLEQAEQLLNEGMITGFGANAILSIGKALQKMGVAIDPDPIKNTEAYFGLMVNETAQIIKQFGAGTGLSDADREYAEKAAAGKVDMTKASLGKIISINKKARVNALKSYNEKAEQVMNNPNAQESLLYDLRVKMPETKSTSGPKVIASPEDIKLVKPGETYIYNGKTYVRGGK